MFDHQLNPITPPTAGLTTMTGGPGFAGHPPPQFLGPPIPRPGIFPAGLGGAGGAGGNQMFDFGGLGRRFGGGGMMAPDRPFNWSMLPPEILAALRAYGFPPVMQPPAAPIPPANYVPPNYQNGIGPGGGPFPGQIQVPPIG